jgi:FkbM family methyltransferase
VGLNLIRYVTDEQYRALKRYKWTKDTTPLDVEYPNAVGGVVLDFGGYSGGFALRCERELSAKVYCYEPVPQFQTEISKSLPENSRIELRRHGVAAETRQAAFHLRGEATGECTQAEDAVIVELQSIDDILSRDAPSGVSLMAMNIEGSEYEVLEKLIDTGSIAGIAHLRVQFHLSVPQARERYASIAQGLFKTHKLVWRYPFIWESWSRKI